MDTRIVSQATRPGTDRPAGSFDENPESATLPMVGAVPLIEDGDRSRGTPLDRLAWAYEAGEIHGLNVYELAVLVYLAYRAGPDLSFVWSESEPAIAANIRCGDRTVRRAIRQLVNLRLVAILRSGRGSFSKLASSYQLQGKATNWHAAAATGTTDLLPAGDAEIAVEQPAPQTGTTGTTDLLQPAPQTGATGTTDLTNPDVTGIYNRDNKQDGVRKSENGSSSYPFSFPTETEDKDVNPETCEDCDIPRFRDHNLCIPHLVKLFWPHLGTTWEKGARVAVRWYEAHPDDFDEQLREVAPVVLQDLGRELISAALAAPLSPPPDLGGGSFRCDLCGTSGAFAVSFDGERHRDYASRDDDGNMERRRCGGTWERIDEFHEEKDGAVPRL